MWCSRPVRGVMSGLGLVVVIAVGVPSATAVSGASADEMVWADAFSLTLKPGEAGSQSVFVVNDGPVDLSVATLVYTPPASFVVEGTGLDGCVVVGAVVECTAVPLAADDVALFEIPVRVAADAPPGKVEGEIVVKDGPGAAEKVQNEIASPCSVDLPDALAMQNQGVGAVHVRVPCSSSVRQQAPAMRIPELRLNCVDVRVDGGRTQPCGAPPGQTDSHVRAHVAALLETFAPAGRAARQWRVRFDVPDGLYFPEKQAKICQFVQERAFPQSMECDFGRPAGSVGRSQESSLDGYALLVAVNHDGSAPGNYLGKVTILSDAREQSTADWKIVVGAPDDPPLLGFGRPVQLEEIE